MVGSMLETLVQLAPLFAGNQKPASPSADGDEEEAGPTEPAADSKQPFDLSAKPDAATIGKYWSYSTGYAQRDGHGLYIHSKINHPK